MNQQKCVVSKKFLIQIDFLFLRAAKVLANITILLFNCFILSCEL